MANLELPASAAEWDVFAMDRIRAACQQVKKAYRQTPEYKRKWLSCHADMAESDRGFCWYRKTLLWPELASRADQERANRAVRRLADRGELDVLTDSRGHYLYLRPVAGLARSG